MNNMNYYHSMLESIYGNIEYYKYMVLLSNNPNQKMFYENLLNNERTDLNYWSNLCFFHENQLYQRTQPSKQDLSDERIFTVEMLAQYDGANGKPAYVAVNGIVYDLSLEPTWGGGTHFGLYAGKDLSDQFNGCHGGMQDVLRNLPQVGVMQDI